MIFDKLENALKSFLFFLILYLFIFFLIIKKNKKIDTPYQSILEGIYGGTNCY